MSWFQEVEVGEYVDFFWFESSSGIYQIHTTDTHLRSTPYTVKTTFDNNSWQKWEERPRKGKMPISFDALLIWACRPIVELQKV